MDENQRGRAGEEQEVNRGLKRVRSHSTPKLWNLCGGLGEFCRKNGPKSLNLACFLPQWAPSRRKGRRGDVVETVLAIHLCKVSRMS
jgi:hypothetical protein